MFTCINGWRRLPIALTDNNRFVTCVLQRKREAADSDGDATTTPSTPSAEDAKREKKKKKKEKRAKLEEAEPDEAGAEPEEVVAEPETEVTLTATEHQNCLKRCSL